MPCKWMHDPEIGRWWYPQCMGGIYGREGCTCDRRGLTKDRAGDLEKRIERLEQKLAKEEAPDELATCGRIAPSGV